MVVVGELRVTAPVTARVPVAVKLPLTVRPAKVGVEVVVTDWLIAEVPSKVKVLLLPCRVTDVMLEFVVVELLA